MNKAEILEIRKQFVPDRNTIDRICGCYVDHAKNRKFTFRKAFGSLPEEEMFKYLDIFSHSLTGTIGRNLIPLEFPLDQEEEGGTQNFLLRLRDSGLKDDILLDEFYDRVIDNYQDAENYYIILINAAYDVPGRTTDGLTMEDASDNVYEYILMSICPVKLSKAGLSYNEVDNCMQDRNRDWVVEGPAKAFLFPAFIDRAADIHNMLYFSKKAEDLQPVFIEAMFGGVPPMSAGEQKDLFQSMVEDAVGDDGDFTTVRQIHENLSQLMEDHAQDETPLSLGREEVRDLLSGSGVDDERVARIDKTWTDYGAGEGQPLLASNIVNTRRFDIEVPDVVVKVKPDRTDLVETREVDGKNCLVIEINGRVEVNGVSVRP